MRKTVLDSSVKNAGNGNISQIFHPNVKPGRCKVFELLYCQLLFIVTTQSHFIMNYGGVECEDDGGHSQYHLYRQYACGLQPHGQPPQEEMRCSYFHIVVCLFRN